MPLAYQVKGGKKRKADYGKENAENEKNKPTAKNRIRELLTNTRLQRTSRA